MLSALRLFSISFLDSLRHPGTTYFCQYPGYLDVPIIRVATLFRACPIVFDPFISLYDTAVSDRELVQANSLTGKILLLVDRIALNCADVVLSDTHEHARFYAELGHIPESNIFTIPIGVNEDHFYPNRNKDRTSTLESLSEKLAKEVGYYEYLILFYGTYIPLHGIDQIIEAIPLVKSKAGFLLVGNGQTRPKIEQKARDLKLKNVWFADSQPIEVIADLVSVADLILGVFGSSEKSRRVVPNKVVQTMASEIALITQDSAGVREVLPDGALVSPDPASIAHGIDGLLGDPRKDQLAMQLRAAYLKFFSPSTRSLYLRQALESASKALRPHC